MYPLDLPASAPNSTLAGAPRPSATASLTVEGPLRPFPELLAELAMLLAGAQAPQAGGGDTVGAGEAEADDGNDVPDLAGQPGNALPLALAVVLDPALIVPMVVAAPQPQAMPAEAAGELPVMPHLLHPAGPGAHALEGSHPELDPAATAEPESQPGKNPVMAALMQVADLPVEQLAPAARAIEPGVIATPTRDAAAPASPSPQGSAGSGAAPAPGSQIEQLVEALAVARQAGRDARGELALRHGEFGVVAIRLEQAEGETRAVLAGRDPGFAPAIVAALADRASAGFADQHQPSHQRGSEQAGQQAATNGSGEGPGDRAGRRAASQPETSTGANGNPSTGEDTDRPQPLSGRFA